MQNINFYIKTASCGQWISVLIVTNIDDTNPENHIYNELIKKLIFSSTVAMRCYFIDLFVDVWLPQVMKTTYIRNQQKHERSEALALATPEFVS